MSTLQFEDIERTVVRHFEALPSFRTNDLITRDQVEPLLTKVQQTGLPLPDKRQILDRVPAKGEFLVDQLSTPKGREFMRRIAKDPGGFDRLDRLSRLPIGPQTIRDLIKGPDGDKMIEYMTTTPGGKQMGKMLSRAAGGANFNAPTGRIYTVALLLEQLKKSLAAAQKPAALTGSAGQN